MPTSPTAWPRRSTSTTTTSCARRYGGLLVRPTRGGPGRASSLVSLRSRPDVEEEVAQANDVPRVGHLRVDVERFRDRGRSPEEHPVVLGDHLELAPVVGRVDTGIGGDAARDEVF